ncbi:MAG: hypothetical protein IAF58_09960 [Leptolyngbya sp.]|nr:hypothetical protein [Candidatus Melainabacteria bacterium]
MKNENSLRMLFIAQSTFTLSVADSLAQNPKTIVSGVITDRISALNYISSGAIGVLDAIVIELSDFSGSNQSLSTTTFDELILNIRRQKTFTGKTIALLASSNSNLAAKAFSMGCDSYFCFDVNETRVDVMAKEMITSIETGALMISPQLKSAFYAYCNGAIQVAS